MLADHLADALVATELDEVRSAKTVADLGSGAGVPGLPLAIAKPDARFALVESNARKCEFLRAAVSTCGLANVQVVRARVEAWDGGLQGNELVTARALGPLPVVLEYAAPLLILGGKVVMWRGERDPEDERAGAKAALELGLVPAAPRRVDPYPEARSRHLHVFTKERPTPARFPRRPGMARKRPLGRT